MIISASRRTDIPAFYPDWFMNRIKEGFVHVRNPMNYHQVSKVDLRPGVIDCIVFWSKNVAPFLQYISDINDHYHFYFQYSINAYNRDIEPYLPNLSHRLDSFRRLSDQVGPHRVIWRYDPILISDKIDIQWHFEQFETIAKHLKGYTETCVFSFIDLYEKVYKNVSSLGIRTCTNSEMNDIAKVFSSMTHVYQMKLQTCAEKIDLNSYGIEHGHCIDSSLIEKITGRKVNAKKDSNQREVCGCLESIDIGQYNTCRHGCKYCYANYNSQSAITCSSRHNPNSSFLIGNQDVEDKISERKMKSLLGESAGQLSMF